MAVLWLRTEATGYGLCYFTEADVKSYAGKSFDGADGGYLRFQETLPFTQRKKATELGGKVVALSLTPTAIYTTRTALTLDRC